MQKEAGINPIAKTPRHALALAVALGCLLTALVSHAYAAAGTPIWTNRYDGPANSGDYARVVTTDGSGNVFVMGWSTGDGSSDDYATIKYSDAGVPLWTNRYNGPGNSFDDSQAMAVDESGNVLVTGFSFSGTDNDFATVAYSSAGALLWVKRYNGPANSEDRAYAVVVDRNGNVFVTGESWGGSSKEDYATVAYSRTGVPLWTNRYNGTGNNSDYANAAAVDGSGDVFVTGSSWGGSNDDYTTIKYSGAGVPLWTNRYNGPGNGSDLARAVAVDGNGNVFVTGDSHNGVNFDYATVAYSSAGAPIWTNRYNGLGNSDDTATAVAVDGSGNVFVTGNSGGNYATIKYSGAGVPLWTNRYNGPGNNYDIAYAMAVDGRGNVIVTGSSVGSGSTNDYATVAYSSAGVPLWTNRYNGSGNNDDYANSVALDINGNVFVTGHSVGSGNGNDYVTIKYVAIPPAPLTLTQAAADEGQFQFQFNADSNLTYAVEFRDFLNSSNWVTLTNFAASQVATNFTFTNAITNGTRFYRVRTP